MKKIIALYRCAKTGKTSTLNLLIEFLDKNKKVEENHLTEDRRVSIFYGNKKIAITTWGDNGFELKENIKYFEEEDCDILVTATRTRGETTEILNDYAKEINTKIVWIEKNISASLEELINQTQAKDIQAVIDSLIDDDH
ncbi:hypothetical protein HQ45_03390 [Porphyromonas crevioricanis]|uniref:Uncharacterized protein n=1 Tax=Bacteroides pyogenes F0041 TaxID=1321819 RepID=U2C2F5_9BACE|nr:MULTISPECIES: hypothetical protein [Bacteroidales]GAE23705.1 hypothetical protein JCM10003_3517 [Bacteroides pyogenes JCM 10003]ERI84634.1 hypothetical protein HMPREF1981_02271 [Bacteroides pyogenes F0041]KGN90473.1 hypothetical protein HQ45_03390 [Porphyromonas crevioricanis]MBB3896458.1 hypothetical protein [Bacteroides pyogenes]SUV36103.1 Uncharacterised protein [Bacteroides pyogenes]